MALELRLQQKMVQQLVMTPQLQQAIKLLQLSHMEMAEALQTELQENPVLEELGEGNDERDEGPGDAGANESEPGTEYETQSGGESDGDDSGRPENPDPATPSEGDLQVLGDALSVLDAPNDATPEPTSKEVDHEMDWDSYLEAYSFSLPASAGGAGGEETTPFEASLTHPTSLHDFLRWQVQMGDFSERERTIAVLLIEDIDDDGYLAEGAFDNVAYEIDAEAGELETVLRALQSLEPPGIGARNLRECLLIQAAQRGWDDPLVQGILDRHLPDVERRAYPVIAKALGASLEQVGAAIRLIGQLEPRPGRTLTEKEPQYITPDIYVHKVGDGWAVVLNEDGLPRLRVSNYYRNALQQSAGNTKNYIQDKLRSAMWLMRSIHMRQRTIHRVMESILKFQKDFFDHGVSHLRPLILRDVAEDIGMHESTISRVTSNKYVHTPRGIYELKYFFNSSLSRDGGDSIASASVREDIKQIIDHEDAAAPVSDQRIVEMLGARGITIARRTVAKYREMMKIASSSKRRRVLP